MNPVISSSLDFLPTAVALAGGTTEDGIHLDGRDLSFTLFDIPDPAAEPEGSFVYWCGTYIMAVRTGRYKVIWKAQEFVGKRRDEPTLKTYCAGTGNCCVDTPTRLCNCQWAKDYTDNPLLIDLINNPYEDTSLSLNASLNSTKLIIEKAMTIRSDRAKAVLETRNIPYAGLSVEDMLLTLAQTPNLMQVDYCPNAASDFQVSVQNLDLNTCLGEAEIWEIGACEYVPKQCVISDFSPYENCPLASYQGASCQNDCLVANKMVIWVLLNMFDQQDRIGIVVNGKLVVLIFGVRIRTSQTIVLCRNQFANGRMMSTST